MKVAIVLLALVSIAFSAPQPRKVFHENVEDFLDLIEDVAGEDIRELMDKYIEFEEFQTSIDYLRTNDFKSIVYDIESLAEFGAVIDFLENDNIDVHYFLDRFNDIIEAEVRSKKKSARVEPSGSNFSSFIQDCIKLFPKDQLSALFDQKMEEDEEFRVAMENLLGDEWRELNDALWNSDVFQAEVKILSEHGIELFDLLDELLAVFGQN